MVSSRTPLFTEAEYLALEAASATKHEFVNGHIVAMTGARPAHNKLVARIIVLLDGLTRKRGCAVFASDQRVHVSATGLYTYPDVTVVCGDAQYKDDSPPSLLNPTVLVEVTSDSTEDYDRGTKFLHYQSIASLAEYIVVSHREQRIDHHRRMETGQWLATPARSAQTVESHALGGTFSVREVYHGIDLAEGA